MSIKERYKNLWNDRQNRLRYAYIASIVVIVIMVLLQPFGIDRIKEYKYPIIFGYGIMTFFACILADIATFMFSGKINPNTISWNVFYKTIFSDIFMAFFISVYSAVIFMHNWRDALFYPDGTFYISTLAINFLYALIISFFILVCIYFVERNKELKQLLKEEIELNMSIQKRISKIATDKANREISIQGTTKESLTIPSSQFIYCEADGNYITVFYLDDSEKPKKATLRLTMKQLEDELKDENNLVRCHRAYIVNTEKVIHVSGNSQGFKLKVEGSDKEIPVSRGYAQDIYDMIHKE